MNKITLKDALFVIVLMGILIFSYLYTKKNKNYNASNQTVMTSQGEKKFVDVIAGKPSLVYFGFLNCPDACPTTFSLMSRAFKELNQDEMDKFNFIFVDLDPERDTLEKMLKYSEYFHPKIFPVIVPLKDLDDFTKYFGIAFMKVKLNSTMTYTIDHSVDVVVLSKEGKFLEPIHHDSTKAQVLSRLKELIKQ